MTADIEPLPTKTGPGWGSKAAAGDALSRVPNDAPFLAVWITKDGKGEDVVKWSKANTDFLKLGTMALIILEYANACIRSAKERAG